MATRPGFFPKSSFSHTGERPGLVVFAVVAVTFGDSDPGGGVGPWENDSLDVQLVAVVSREGLGCVSSVLLGVCGEVEGSVDNDTLS